MIGGGEWSCMYMYSSSAIHLTGKRSMELSRGGGGEAFSALCNAG